MARRQAEIRKLPDTSIDTKVESMRATLLVLLPTHQLEPRAGQIFGMIMSMRPAAMWGTYDLHLATELAEINAQIEWTQEVLAVEGDVLTTRLGTPIINPRATHRGNLKRQAVTFVRALGLTGLPAVRKLNIRPCSLWKLPDSRYGKTPNHASQPAKNTEHEMCDAGQVGKPRRRAWGGQQGRGCDRASTGDR